MHRVTHHPVRRADHADNSRQRGPGRKVLQCKGVGPSVSNQTQSIVDQVLNSPGKPLDPATRGFFEARFRHDFSRVRIHADSQGSESAKLVRANAYTVGNHVAFDNGYYSPQSPDGRKLLAHELAHTVQQSQTQVTPTGTEGLQISEPGDASERQADAAAERLLSTEERSTPVSESPMKLNSLPKTSLQRKETGEGANLDWKKLSDSVNAAALQAGQKVQEKGLDKPHGHTSVGPQPRRVPETPRAQSPAVHVPPENLRPPPRDKGEPGPAKLTPEKPPSTPAQTTPSQPAHPEPDKGSSEWQYAQGSGFQSGPGQGGMMVQAAHQDPNYVPGIARDFLKYFHLQLGILQPTLALQLTYLKPLAAGSPPLRPLLQANQPKTPLPPPVTAQLGFTISPMVLKVGAFTIAPQIGPAVALAGGAPASVAHGQLLGVINLQVDYKLSDLASLTGAFGAQGGLDVAKGQGAQPTGNVNGSFLATLHF